jgi:hypothetical protein
MDLSMKESRLPPYLNLMTWRCIWVSRILNFGNIWSGQHHVSIGFQKKETK